MKIIREGKLYPTKKQKEVLVSLLEECRTMYNKILEVKQVAYQDEGKTISRFEMQKIVKEWGGNIPATLKQMLVYRVNIAFERFFKNNSKFPRFKSENRMRSIDLRQYGSDYKINDKTVTFWKIIGKTKIRGLQSLNNPSMGRIVKRASGWYLQVTDEVELVEVINEKVIGIDLGLKSFVADSNGKNISAPKFFKQTQSQLRTRQRKLKNKVKFSRRWKKQALIVAKTYEKVANQRKDWLHKISREYANNYGIVYAEDLNISGMLKNHHLAKSISDASWGTFLQMLSYKLEMLGGELVLVSPKYTSQKCSNCGDIVPKSLSVRTHVCSNCGYVDDRDTNAAKNILKSGLGISLQVLT